MTELYREFTLRGRADWAEVVSTVRAAAPTMARDGRPMRVILVDADGDRLDEQVKFYFKAVIEQIAEQIWIEGRRYSPRAWHRLMKTTFLPPVEMRLPDGTVEMMEPSIARGEITVAEMAEYTEKVSAHAAVDYGVQFD